MLPEITRHRGPRRPAAALWPLLIALLFSGLPGRSQDAGARQSLPDYRFERFELPGGNSGNSVQSIVQDSLGFLWFASQGGLHRYDGYRVKSYFHDPADPGSLSSSYIECLLIDRRGRLWAGTWGGGLNRFDYRTEAFVRYPPAPRDRQGLTNGFISRLVEDRDGTIWVATLDGLHHLDPGTGRFRRYGHDPADPRSLSNNEVRELLIDRAGELWAGTGFPFDDEHSGGLNRFERHSGTFTRYQHAGSDPATLTNDEVRALFEDSRGNFWVGTSGDGLHRLDRRQGAFTHIPRDGRRPGQPRLPHLPNAKAQPGVSFIFEDDRRRLWFGTFSEGLAVYDPASGQQQHFQVGLTAADGLTTNNTWTMFQAADGTLWLAGGGMGPQVFRVVPQQTDFVSFTFDKFLITAGAVRDMLQDAGGDVWFGTEADGLLHLDTQRDKFRQYRHDPADAATLSSDNIHRIFQDSRGFLWISFRNDDAGLDRLDPRTGGILHFRHDPRRAGSLSNDRVTDIAETPDGALWVATAGGLNRYDPATGGFRRFLAVPKDADTATGLMVNSLTRLHIDRRGRLWIGGGGEAGTTRQWLLISCYDPQEDRFTHYSTYDLSRDDIYPWASFIDEDDQGRIWLTTPRSLLRLDPESGTFRRFFGDRNSLYRSEIRGAARDGRGNFWILGSEGLAIFNPRQETYLTYDRIDGKGNWKNYYWHSIARLSSGELLFGTVGGCYILDPNRLLESINAVPPRAMITGLSIFDEPADQRLGQPIWNLDHVRLAARENVFSLDFAALHFQNPEANRIEYMLDGYDDTWRRAGPQASATYIKVPPGSYRFRVRVANNFGIWSEREAALGIVVAPPWWQTWWAYLLFAATALLLLYALYRFHFNRQMMRAEARRLRELHEVRTRLYTNITHEFRTPLTIISGMAGQIRDDPERWLDRGVDMISRNSEQLLRLVNDLLDLRRLEAGRLPQQLQQGDVIPYLRYLIESMHSYAESKGIALTFRPDVPALIMDHDPEKLQNMLSNLLSNAIKFTPAGGEVTVDLRLTTADLPPSDPRLALALTVRDTGPGIPAGKLPFVFDPFYQADDSPTRRAGGSGIGLALARELARLLGGDIRARSQPGQGAEFTVWLPVTRQAPPAGESTAPPRPDLVSAPAAGPAPRRKKNRDALPASRPLVLVIEDNPDVVEYLDACLGDEFRLAVAADGQAGVERAFDLIPDLIISDVMMPGRDGFDVCATLKADERTCHIPILLLTARVDHDSRITGLERGADVYLEKPFHREELLVRLRKLLELRRRLQEHYRRAAGLDEGAVVIRPLPDPAAREDDFVQRVRDVVEERLDDFDFGVSELCAAVNLSRSQLHRKLSAVTGLSPNKFIRAVRLQRARTLLRDPGQSVAAVAFDTGFQDPDYFARVFRQETGVTPSEFRLAEGG